MTSKLPNVDVNRLFEDLHMSEATQQSLATLDISPVVGVLSRSAIKIDTVGGVLDIIKPDEHFEVTGVDASSDIAEQPLGQTTITGALNRLDNGIRAEIQNAGQELRIAAWFSLENGLFRVSPQGSLLAAPDRNSEGISQFFTEGANLSSDFDPNAEYEDRAVAVIRVPGYPRIVQISPSSEAVRFPKEAVEAAYSSDGSFDKHTVGSKLAEMGIVRNKQDPHSELTLDRPGGPLTRQDQMARVMIRGLIKMAQS